MWTVIDEIEGCRHSLPELDVRRVIYLDPLRSVLPLSQQCETGEFIRLYTTSQACNVLLTFSTEFQGWCLGTFGPSLMNRL